VTLLIMRGAADVLGVRFAWSPVWETMHAVRTFSDPRARPYHQGWHRLVADRAARIDLEPLTAVQPLRGFVPDFLTPPPRTPAPRVREQLAEVRATPVAQVESELRLCRQSPLGPRQARLVDAYLDDPAAARDFLASRLHEAWREFRSAPGNSPGMASGGSSTSSIRASAGRRGACPSGTAVGRPSLSGIVASS
jgi:hypothetical protein